jgi:UPF0716 protein FxsA
MILIFFLIFIILPIGEIAVFLEAGRTIGVLPTIAITLATTFLGSFLLRTQGFATMQRFMQCVERDELPLEPVLDGMGVLIAGVLLMVPGFITDAIGMLLFMPPVRRAFGRVLFRQLSSGDHVRFHYYGHSAEPRPSRPEGTVKRPVDNVVDADFETVDPRDEKEKPTPVEPADNESCSGDPNSPWRKK